MVKNIANSSLIFKKSAIKNYLDDHNQNNHPNSIFNIHDVIHPVYSLLKPATLWPYEYNNERTEPLPKIKKIQAIFTIILIIAYYVYLFVAKLESPNEDRYTALLITDALDALFIHMLVIISIYFTVFTKSGPLTEQFLVQFEKVYKQEIICCRTLQKRIKLQTYTIFFSGAFFNLLNAAVSITVIGLIDIRDYSSIYILQVFETLIFLKINMKVELLLLYFQGINDRFDYCKNSQKKTRELSRIFSALCNLIHVTNEAHGWEIAIFLVTTVARMLHCLELIILTSAPVLGGESALIIKILTRTALLFNTLFFVILVIMLGMKCSSVKHEALKTADLANNMLLKIPSENMDTNAILYRKELKLLIAQVFQRRPNFSAAGIFNVDYTIISTILAVVASYFIVFLQF